MTQTPQWLRAAGRRADNEDQRAAARPYLTLFDFTADLQGEMQVIVTDHVELSQPWLRHAIRQRRRDGIKFVPVDWLREASAPIAGP